MTGRSSSLQLGMLGLGCLIASSAFSDAFVRSDLVPIAVVCALVPIVGSAVTHRILGPRAHAAVSVAALLGMYLVTTGMVVFRLSAPTVEVSGWVPTIAEGLSSGWRELLSATAPAPSRPELLVIPTTVLWMVTSVAAELTIRTRLLLGPLVPPVVGWTVAMLLSVGDVTQATMAATSFVVVAGLFVVLRAGELAGRHDPAEAAEPGPTEPVYKRLTVQRALASLPAVGLVAAAGALVGANLPFVDAQDPVLLRDSYEAPLRPQVEINPLASVGAPVGDQIAFSVQLDGDVPERLRMRLQVLDSYDGLRWTSRSSFQDAGPVVPGDGALVPPDGRRVTQTVELKDLASQFLPAADRPVELATSDGALVDVDPVSGVLALANVADGRVRYEVTSLVGEIDRDLVALAGVATTDDARQAVDFEYQLPAEAQSLAAEATASASSPFQQVAMLLALFKGLNPADPSDYDFVVQPEMRTSLDEGRIAAFVAGPDEAARTGPPQLFAASFTLLARSIGLPARLVVGYEVVPGDDAGQPVEVRADQLTVWTEVGFADLGWVAFEPYKESSDLPPPPEQRELDAAVEEAASAGASNDAPSSADNPNAPGTEEPGASTTGSRWLALFAAVVVSAATVVVLPALLKRRRRRRRLRASSPADRVVGAWQEVVDRLVERGLEDRSLLTPAEIATRAARYVADPPDASIASLGSLVTTAVNGPTLPTDAVVGQAWHLETTINGQIRRSTGLWQRCRASLSVRSLVGDGKADR